MSDKKHVLQKVSLVFSVLFFVGAIVCAGFLLWAGSDASKVFKASFGASMFFCFMVSVVLHVMGSANLPSFKMEDAAKEGES